MKRRVSDLVVKPAGDDVGHKLGLAQRTIIRDVTQHYKTHLVKISRNPKLVGVSGKVSSNGRSGRICLGILLDRKIGNERCVRNGRSTRSEQLFDMKRCTRSKGQRESNVGGEEVVVEGVDVWLNDAIWEVSLRKTGREGGVYSTWSERNEQR